MKTWKTGSAGILPALLLLSMTGCGGPASSPRPDVTAAAPAARPPKPGIYSALELNRTDLAQLNKETCFVLQPVAPLAIAGQHIPSGSALLLTEELTRRVAAELRVRRPEWSVLILPALPVGGTTANQIGYMDMHPASQPVSTRTLQILMGDWVLNQGENAYLTFFMISLHPDPLHHQSLNDVAQFSYFNYRLRCADVSSFVLADSTWLAEAAAIGRRHWGPEITTSPVFELAGGAAATSLMMDFRPDLVAADYREMPACPVGSWDDAVNRAYARGWLGYFGHPAKAGAAGGRELWKSLVDAHVRFVLRRADQDEPLTDPRIEAVLQDSPNLRDALRSNQGFYDKTNRRFDTWIKWWADEDRKVNGNKAVRP